MNLTDMIKAKRAALAALMTERGSIGDSQKAILATVEAEGRSALNDTEETEFEGLRERKLETDKKIELAEADLEKLVREQKADEDFAERAAQSAPSGTERRAYDEVARVGAEKRTYSAESDKSGREFLLDVARSQRFGDSEAGSRLARHMTEERVERGDKLQRAVGTGGVSGLVVPQYLVDMYAPKAQALRPFADVCNRHDLPETGMTVHLGKVTTSTSTDDQANEGDAVDETDFDDTLLTIPVRTNAGQQTLSRQAVERGIGVDNVVVEDLFKSYSTRLDSNLINHATTGLSAVANLTAYTDADASPAELHPKIMGAAAGVEASLLGYGSAKLAVMHSRRWWWLQAQVGSVWPAFGQPGLQAQTFGENFGNRYGSGFRGVLPGGLAAIVDNNIATSKGVGTNEDELFVVDNDECHLWEDPDAPMMIRTEEVKAATLQILFVLYGYYAYTYERFDGAVQKVGGTGLITPTF